eukprot:XP_013985811.1 PREDICTED: UPF0469 protein KIAA0907 homolog [Salmo salar]
MAQTNLQLFELNQRTISQWYSRRQKERERMVLQQGLGLAVAPSVTAQPLPEAKPLHYQREGIQAPFPFPTPPPPGPTPDHPARRARPSAHSASPPGATTPRTSRPLPSPRTTYGLLFTSSSAKDNGLEEEEDCGRHRVGDGREEKAT